MGLTEDVFISATLRLSRVCLGGIDAHLSEVSSDSEEGDDEEGEEDMATGGNKEQRPKPVR